MTIGQLQGWLRSIRADEPPVPYAVAVPESAALELGVRAVERLVPRVDATLGAFEAARLALYCVDVLYQRQLPATSGYADIN